MGIIKIFYIVMVIYIYLFFSKMQNYFNYTFKNVSSISKRILLKLLLKDKKINFIRTKKKERFASCIKSEILIFGIKSFRIKFRKRLIRSKKTVNRTFGGKLCH